QDCLRRASTQVHRFENYLVLQPVLALLDVSQPSAVGGPLHSIDLAVFINLQNLLCMPSVGFDRPGLAEAKGTEARKVNDLVAIGRVDPGGSVLVEDLHRCPTECRYGPCLITTSSKVGDGENPSAVRAPKTETPVHVGALQTLRLRHIPHLAGFQQFDM